MSSPHQVRDALIAALLQRRVRISSDKVHAYQEGGLTRFVVRLAANYKILPSSASQQLRINRGVVAPHSLQGAKYLMLGAVQQFGNAARLTVRIDDVETGAILKTGRGDGTPDAAGLTGAAAAALRGLGVAFSS
jgi:hypothetical protein